MPIRFEYSDKPLFTREELKLMSKRPKGPFSIIFFLIDVFFHIILSIPMFLAFSVFLALQAIACVLFYAVSILNTSFIGKVGAYLGLYLLFCGLLLFPYVHFERAFFGILSGLENWAQAVFKIINYLLYFIVPYAVMAVALDFFRFNPEVSPGRVYLLCYLIVMVSIMIAKLLLRQSRPS